MDVLLISKAVADEIIYLSRGGFGSLKGLPRTGSAPMRIAIVPLSNGGCIVATFVDAHNGGRHDEGSTMGSLSRQVDLNKVGRLRA